MPLPRPCFLPPSVFRKAPARVRGPRSAIQDFLGPFLEAAAACPAPPVVAGQPPTVPGSTDATAFAQPLVLTHGHCSNSNSGAPCAENAGWGASGPTCLTWGPASSAMHPFAEAAAAGAAAAPLPAAAAAHAPAGPQQTAQQSMQQPWDLSWTPYQKDISSAQCPTLVAGPEGAYGLFSDGYYHHYQQQQQQQLQEHERLDSQLHDQQQQQQQEQPQHRYEHQPLYQAQLPGASDLQPTTQPAAAAHPPYIAPDAGLTAGGTYPYHTSWLRTAPHAEPYVPGVAGFGYTRQQQHQAAVTVTPGGYAADSGQQHVGLGSPPPPYLPRTHSSPMPAAATATTSTHMLAAPFGCGGSGPMPAHAFSSPVMPRGTSQMARDELPCPHTPNGIPAVAAAAAAAAASAGVTATAAVAGPPTAPGPPLPSPAPRYSDSVYASTGPSAAYAPSAPPAPSPTHGPGGHGAQPAAGSAEHTTNCRMELLVQAATRASSALQQNLNDTRSAGELLYSLYLLDLGQGQGHTLATPGSGGGSGSSGAISHGGGYISWEVLAGGGSAVGASSYFQSIGNGRAGSGSDLPIALARTLCAGLLPVWMNVCADLWEQDSSSAAGAGAAGGGASAGGMREPVVWLSTARPGIRDSAGKPLEKPKPSYLKRQGTRGFWAEGPLCLAGLEGACGDGSSGSAGGHGGGSLCATAAGQLFLVGPFYNTHCLEHHDIDRHGCTSCGGRPTARGPRKRPQPMPEEEEEVEEGAAAANEAAGLRGNREGPGRTEQCATRNTHAVHQYFLARLLGPAPQGRKPGMVTQSWEKRPNSEPYRCCAPVRPTGTVCAAQSAGAGAAEVQEQLQQGQGRQQQSAHGGQQLFEFEVLQDYPAL